ncbi:MAG TPA: methylated-DNA--[protein]-cysteine S-methyltransferase [Candidatus Limnocylindrales bacterium]
MNQPALYAIVPAPWGPIHVAATNRGVAGLELLTPTERFVARIERRLRREVVSANRHPGRAADRLDEAVAAVEAYLAGDAVSFELPLDIGDRPGWDRLVLGGVRGVPFGRVTSYGRIARRVGKPGAARAVGGAIGRNPVGLVIPCHRVIAGDGSLGGYGGEWFDDREAMLAVKRALLELEGIDLPANRWLDD